MKWLPVVVTTALVMLTLLFPADGNHSKATSDSDHRRSRLALQSADYDRPDLFGAWMVADLRTDCIYRIHAVRDSGQLLAA